VRRRLALLVPVLAAGGSRVLQLVVLVVLVAQTDGAAESTLVAGLAILSAFAIFTDSGAGNFLLATPEAELGRALHARATLLHLVLATTGGVAALTLTLVGDDSDRGPTVVTILLGLALAQVADSITRTCRAPALVRGDDVAYALPEVVLLAAKLPVLGVVLLTSRPGLLVLLAVPSMVVCLVTWSTARRRLAADLPLPPRVTRRILEFGVSGSLSALYSQAPLLVGTAVLGVTTIAPLALAYRVVQPIEIVPATFAQQLLPRIRTKNLRLLPIWLGFAGSGVLVVVALVALSGPVSAALGSSTFVTALFVPVALSLAPKFGNYALVAVTMGLGFVRRRLVATAVVGCVALVLTTTASALQDVTLLSWSALVSELLLLAVLGSSLTRARSQENPVP